MQQRMEKVDGDLAEIWFFGLGHNTEEASRELVQAKIVSVLPCISNAHGKANPLLVRLMEVLEVLHGLSELLNILLCHLFTFVRQHPEQALHLRFEKFVLREGCGRLALGRRLRGSRSLGRPCEACCASTASAHAHQGAPLAGTFCRLPGPPNDCQEGRGASALVLAAALDTRQDSGNLGTAAAMAAQPRGRKANDASSMAADNWPAGLPLRGRRRCAVRRQPDAVAARHA
eukprot:CAMPEP_0115173754 /NCGR_PEP_ID=MMETSP0270-20121206/3487_1 /TAXON_ID=71861 /ORGANISM="Scrippsiella trochoidea, Strain CCMP3099" /LENGTH=230 /DNA_ID=CAMNT_0002586573 /DNA_START=475 /DNA_END=1163 /DNA_ORIENTATION=+